MSQIILDPIYGTTELETWADDLLRIRELSVQRRRLERIKNLGLIQISFPSATHSKWEHHLGMFHLAKQLHLPKEDKKRLELLCLLGGFGHLPFTFPSEDAVLLAAKLSPRVRRSLNGILEETWKACEKITSEEFRARLPSSPDDIRTEELHAWLTAWKLKRLPRSIDLGDRSQLVYERINVRGNLNELYRFLSRLDYVQRDLYYTGLAKFSLSAEGFLRRYKASIKELSATPEGSLLEQLKSYLADSLYFENASVSREALYKKRLAVMLAGGQLSLEELLKWTDSDLESAIENRGGKHWWALLAHEQFTRICRAKIPQRTRAALEGAEKGRLDIESKIVGLAKPDPKFLIDYPRTQNIIVVARRSSDPRDGRPSTDIFLSAVGKPTNCRPIVAATWNLANVRIPGRGAAFAVWQTLGQDLLAYLLNASVRADFRQIAEVLMAGFEAMPPKNQRSTRRRLDNSSDDFYFYPGSIRSLDYWEDVIKNPSFARFSNENEKNMGEILKSAVQSGKKDFAQVIEAVIWTNELQELKDVTTKWVLPNVMIEGKNGVNQVDAVSLFLQGRKAILRFHECSKSESEGKAFADFQKLEKIKSGVKAFDDLSIQQLVYGASGVREHFSPLQALLDKYKIKEKQITPR